MFHKIKSVVPQSDYTLLVRFVNGDVRVYDVKPLIENMECYESFLQIPDLFRLASVDTGGCGVSWNENLDIDCEELWHNGTDTHVP